MDLQTYKSSKDDKIIHFVANWCIACVQNKNMLSQYQDDILLIDFDNSPEIVEYEKITKVPTILYKDYRIEGVSPSKLRRLLKSFHSQ